MGDPIYSSDQDTILSIIEAHPAGITIESLAEILMVSTEELKLILTNLVNQQTISHDGQKYYPVCGNGVIPG
jgi:DNA-binding IclR family transcriptional regulator